MYGPVTQRQRAPAMEAVAGSSPARPTRSLSVFVRSALLPAGERSTRRKSNTRMQMPGDRNQELEGSRWNYHGAVDSFNRG